MEVENFQIKNPQLQVKLRMHSLIKAGFPKQYMITTFLLTMAHTFLQIHVYKKKGLPTLKKWSYYNTALAILFVSRSGIFLPL